MVEPVCVIITNWNQVDYTLACIETVIAQDYEQVSIMVVDNGSTDGTVDKVSAAYPQVDILALTENLGPTGGYNSGFRRALDNGFNFIFLLNNDTLLARNCISELVKDAQSSSDIGLVMPKIYYADEPALIWSVGGWENSWNYEVRRPGEKQVDQGQWEAALDIDDAPFCAVLLTRNLLQTVGLPDEDYFLYYEDRDFCRRAKDAGFRLRLAPKATMLHKVSVSSGGSGSPNERYWMARSSVIYFRKHAHGFRIAIVIFWRFGSAVRTSWKLLSQKRMPSLKAYWKGLADGFKQPISSGREDKNSAKYVVVGE